jgi:hypothetical protein
MKDPKQAPLLAVWWDGVCDPPAPGLVEFLHRALGRFVVTIVAPTRGEYRVLEEMYRRLESMERDYYRSHPGRSRRGPKLPDRVSWSEYPPACDYRIDAAALDVMGGLPVIVDLAGSGGITP